MTTTARTATRQIATTTAALFELVILGAEFDECEICKLPAAEVRCCEDCVDHADVSYVAD